MTGYFTILGVVSGICGLFALIFPQTFQRVASQFWPVIFALPIVVMIGRWTLNQLLDEDNEYQFQYFTSDTLYYPTREDLLSDEARDLSDQLKGAKRALQEWLNAQPSTVNEERLREIHDYVFRFAKDFWHIQQNWFEANGQYFQGKETMPEPPDYKKNGKVELPFGLTDQIDDWRAIGYADEYAPVQLRSDVYTASQGSGFILTARVEVEEEIWKLQMNFGPEDRPHIDNFRWVKDEPFPTP